LVLTEDTWNHFRSFNSDGFSYTAEGSEIINGESINYASAGSEIKIIKQPIWFSSNFMFNVLVVGAITSGVMRSTARKRYPQKNVKSFKKIWLFAGIIFFWPFLVSANYIFYTFVFIGLIASASKLSKPKSYKSQNYSDTTHNVITPRQNYSQQYSSYQEKPIENYPHLQPTIMNTYERNDNPETGDSGYDEISQNDFNNSTNEATNNRMDQMINPSITQFPKLSKEKELELLRVRLLAGDISEQLYIQLRGEITDSAKTENPQITQHSNSSFRYVEGEELVEILNDKLIKPSEEPA